MIPCTFSGSGRSSARPRFPRAGARTARRRAGCRPRARAATAAGRREERIARAAARAAAPSPRRRAARSRASAHSSCRRPSPGAARAAPAGPYRRRGAGRPCSSRRDGRRSRAGRRRPSADPRRRAPSDAAPRAPRGTGARRRTARHAVAAELPVRAEADQRDGGAPTTAPARPSTPATASASFALGLLGRVRLEDSGVSLRHLGERPVRHPLAVRQRAALPPVVDDLRVGVHDARELVHEPALADPRDAHERDELRRALLSRALESIRQEVELALAADEGFAGLDEVDAETRARPIASQAGTGSAFPLASTGSASR